ncbi:50S ribosomal protein L20 [Candidatus Berkelbacteria bacterium]|nr:50S ribosomal protein L20 [Candidatus Berkelbacteria bacterium]
MARVKRGVIAHKRHKNLLKATKGYRHGRKKLFRLAKQAWLKAGEHAFAHRRTKKRDFRGLWIIRLNAAVRHHDLSYSQFIHGLKLAEITLDRKVLSQLAVQEPVEFTQVVERVKTALTQTN